MSFFYKERKKMKMTPEQKAFYELGAAKAFLFNKIEVARNYARQFYGESYCELTRKERADCWKHSEIKFFIKLVRERRATCRAWVPLERRWCRTCRYRDEIRNFGICRDCTPGIHLENFCNWEPGAAADAAGENTDVNPHNSLKNEPAQVGETMADGKEGK